MRTVFSKRVRRAILVATMGLSGSALVAQGVTNDSSSTAADKRLSEVPAGYPVAPFGDTLFHVNARMGSHRPKERAKAIEERIKRIGDRTFFAPDSLKVDTVEGLLDIIYEMELVMSIGKKDAQGSGMGMHELAADHRDRIAAAIQAKRDEMHWTALAKQIALALLVVGLLMVVLRLIARAFRWVRGWLERRSGEWLKGIRIRDYEILTQERALQAVLFLITVMRWFAVLLVLYLALPAVFAIFPWTQDIAETLIGYFTRPLFSILQSLWEFLPNLITIVVILFVFRYVIKGLAFLRNEVANGVLVLPGFYPDWAAPTFQLLRIILLAFMIVVIFPYLPGSDSPVFKGVSVFLGALFTFGSAGSLSNIIAGLVLTYMRSFQIGDRVKIGEVFGDVIERTMLTTRVRTIKNEIISIPNSSVIGSHTINYSSDAVGRGLIIHSTVTIGYDAPWRQVHQLLIDAAKATEYILPEHEPFVLQTSLDDFYVTYQINAYTKEPTKQAVIYSQLHQNIQDQFNAAGVEIMSPHYRAARDGNHTTVSSDRVPPNYVAPWFRVRTSKEP